MLSLEPEERPSLQEILESPWLQESYHEEMPEYFFSEIEELRNKTLASSLKEMSISNDPLSVMGDLETLPF